MNATITLSVRTFVIGLVVLVALVVAYQLGGSGGGTTAVAADTGDSAAAPPVRQLAMNGTGKAGAVPDQLSFALAVDLTRPDLDEALEAANTSMARVLRSLRKH